MPSRAFDIAIKANNALQNTSGVSFSGNLNVPTGNLGIGVTSSNTALEVKSNNEILRLTTTANVSIAGQSAYQRFNDVNGNSGFVGFGGGIANAFEVYNYKNGPLVFTTNNAERMRIDSSGNVGIGPTTTNRINLSYNGVTGIATIGPNSTGGSTTLQLGTSNAGTYADRLTIDSSGRVTIPYQPAFHATSSNAPSSGQQWVFNSAAFNVGNYFNGSNGRFTAPVNGTYYFYVYGLTANPDTSDTRITLRVNGTTYSGMRFILTKTAASWETIMGFGLIYLNVNDWVSPYNEQSGLNFHGDANYTGFGGYLIG